MFAAGARCLLPAGGDRCGCPLLEGTGQGKGSQGGEGGGRKPPFGVEVRRLSGGACKEESGVHQGVLGVEEKSLLFAFPAVLEIDGRGNKYNLYRAVCCSKYPWHSRRTNKQAGGKPSFRRQRCRVP